VFLATASARPPTRMRYDRARKNLDRHPNYILAPIWHPAPNPPGVPTAAEIGECHGWVCGICQDVGRLVDPRPTAPRALRRGLDSIAAVSRRRSQIDGRWRSSA